MPKKVDARTFGQDLMRGEHVIGGGGMKPPAATAVSRRLAPGGGGRGGGAWLGGPKTASSAKFGHENDEPAATGTSIFDPVLCELSYRWFCPPGGLVLDPFAGGSVRGIVASKLGRQYVGLDLRPEQVAANIAQAAAICGDPMPVWHCGDSREIGHIAEGVHADFVFSCPP